jgi:CheY-like chemotaxis protein/DNA-directed RNA polymerase specialized sigma24 family protein
MEHMLAEKISAHLPRLRRFARLLAGSQQAGDAAVARLLQKILADPSIFPELPPRIGLYRCFLDTFTSRFEEVREDATGLGPTASRSLAALGAQARPMFLLVAVEEFKLAEAAVILGVSERRAEDLLEQAGRTIGNQITTEVLIIEDEPLIALNLKVLLADLGHRVTSVVRTRGDAVRAAAKTKPGLVLADLRLADGSSGLDAVNDILSAFTVPVIFVTAFPEALMSGERPEPTFLITKPFREDAVKAVVSQVLFFDQEATRRNADRAPTRTN